MSVPPEHPIAGGAPPAGRRSGPLARVLTLLVAVVLLTGACDARTSAPTSRTTPTTTPLVGLPAFADWRAVYADADWRIHAISTDGTRDAAGPTLTGLYGSGTVFHSPSASPDGHWLAYGCVQGVCILDLTGRHAPLTYAPVNRGYAWSLDSSTLAVDDESAVHVPDGQIQQIPPIQGAGLELIGWVDATHLAGAYYRARPQVTPAPTSTPRSDIPTPAGPQTATLAVQDITTGAARIVFSLTSSSLGLWYFRLAPDGKHALFYNSRWRADPYTPDVRLIDLATGAVTRLPHLTQAMGQNANGSGFTSLAWRAGTLTLAASTGDIANGDIKTWVLDAEHDTARALPYQEYIGGWAPNSDTLILTTTYFSEGGAGPFTLTAVAGAASGPGTAATLTTRAYHLSFGGFTRTSS